MRVSLLVFFLMFASACAQMGTDGADRSSTPVTEPGASAVQERAFGPLVGLVGKRFRGIPGPGSSVASADVQAWSWALGGAAIRVEHALEDGSYGGVTYVYPDRQSGALAYVYITNSGFRTEGRFKLNPDGSWTAEEEVIGRGDISRVRTTGRIREDGTLLSEGTYLKGDQWVPGPRFRYVETDKPLPVLDPPGQD